MEEKPVRKTTAKKVVRRVASKKVPARTVERKPTVATSPVRKAPARVVLQTPKKSKKNFKVVLLGLVLFGMLFGVSALIGFSDKGELDVAGKIADRKTNATSPEEQASLQGVSDVNTQKPSTASSLVGMGSEGTIAPAPIPQPEATSTPQQIASTTPEAATTTPEVAPQDTSSETPAS